MNKSLIRKSIIFMSAFFLSSYSLVADYLNADIRDRLYNTHNAYIDMYHITGKDKISNDLDDKFSWSNKKITSYLQRQDNIEQYLRNVGALCPEDHHLCYVIFFSSKRIKVNV